MSEPSEAPVRAGVAESSAPPPSPGDPAPLAAGETVLLTDRKGRRYLIRLVAEGEFHFHGGAVAHDDLIGATEGSYVRSARGQQLLVVRPTGVDWTLKAKRGAQVVYPKDQALIVMFGDIAPGCEVVEAGAGSGALTCALLRAVGAGGRVTSYELRDEHADVAERNVHARFGGPPPNWVLHRGDVAEGLASHHGGFDRIVLDLLDPAAVLPAAAGALRPGGLLVAYTPTIPQVMALREGLSAEARWGPAETTETLLRGWNIDGLAVRPNHRMVAHTALLTVVRRLAEGEG